MDVAASRVFLGKEEVLLVGTEIDSVRMHPLTSLFHCVTPHKEMARGL